MRAWTLAADLVSVAILLGCLTGIQAVSGDGNPLVKRGTSPDEDPKPIDYELFGGPEPDHGAYNYPTPTYGGYGYPPPPPPPKTSSTLSNYGESSISTTSSSIIGTGLTSSSISSSATSSGIFQPQICETLYLPDFSFVRVKLGRHVSHISHRVLIGDKRFSSLGVYVWYTYYQ